MGRCESVEASLGIKILVSDLVSQIDHQNVDLIKEMLDDGYIEDGDDFFNAMYSEIMDKIVIINCFIELKEYLTHEFKNKGTYIKYKSSGKMEPTIDYGCLLDKYLLVPCKKILENDRWGYEREGTNYVSRPIDFDLRVDLTKYKKIKHIKTVFLIGQKSG